MKNLLLTILLLFTISGAKAQNDKSIFEYSIGDYIDTSFIAKRLQIPYSSFSIDVLTGIENYKIKSFISDIKPIFVINNNELESITFSFF